MRTADSYANSKTAQLRAFFAANPSEFLSYEDIALKLDIPRLAAMKICDRLRDEGLIQRGVMVWLDPDRGQ